MDEEKRYQVALSQVPGIGNINAKNLQSYCGSAQEVFKSKRGLLNKIPGIGTKTIANIGNAGLLRQADQIIEDCLKNNQRILHYMDDDYPRRLKQIADSPNIIYYKGSQSLNDLKTVGIVGTRKATDYGKEITQKLVAEIASQDATIISGLAYGIDIEAHKSALAHDLPTIAVMANGLNKVYPALHKKYIEPIQKNGGLLSENPPETKAEAHFFPARNRIIAGLSDAVIVVEAAAKGGALITANIAFSYDIPVFAIPGSLGSTYSEGCNYLIRNQQAYIYTSVDDLVYHLNWDENLPTKKEPIDLKDLSSEEMAIYELLNQGSDQHIDDIAWKAQLPINQIASHLLNMEFRGLVKSLPGKKFKLL